MISAWWLIAAFLGGMILSIPLMIFLSFIATGEAVGRGLNW
jgi:RsiW-degrading membrane proteinase PrsW (M82 family)